MAEHFKYYPSDEEVITPWNARYSYPSQSNKATKLTPRIPPKNGTSFTPGQIMRLEFPAQGYVNPLNTLLEFDVVMYAPVVSSGAWAIRFQNNIQSIFNRIRLLYGASPQEDILQYGLLVRCLSEWTGTNQMLNIDQGSIADGVGGTFMGSIPQAFTAAITCTGASTTSGTATILAAGFTTAAGFQVGTTISITGFAATNAAGGVVYAVGQVYQVVITAVSTGVSVSFATTATTWTTVTGTATGLVEYVSTVNTRQAFIQGMEGNFLGTVNLNEELVQITTGNGLGLVPNGNNNIPAGVNVPTGAANTTTGANCYCVRRYMVNFALGVFTQDKLIPTKYMASQLAIEVTFEQPSNCMFMPIGYAQVTTQPTYAVANVNLIPEIIEFDDSYDEQFLRALESGGVPIKFSTWHYFQFSTQNSSSLQLQITERSRSVKGIFCVQRRIQSSVQYDAHACFFDTNSSSSTTTGSTMQQYQYRIGGRYFPAAPVQLSAGVGLSMPNGGAEAYVELAKFLNIVGDSRLKTNLTTLCWAVPAIINQAVNLLPEYDYSFSITGYNGNGTPVYSPCETQYSAQSGNAPSCIFTAAINFETSNGIEISGLNAEEQSDISFNVIWSGSQAAGFQIEAFTYVDVMWVLRPNNYLDLIQ